jgi:hypothetical protein
MLVKFNVAPTGVTNNGAVRRLNFLRCIEAIATAAAGSTPSVAPFASYANGSIDNSLECITEVISNTEAGGWSDNTSETYSSRFNLTATNPTTFGSTLNWSLTRPSGKGTHPWYFFGMTADSNISISNTQAENPNTNGFEFAMGATSNKNTLLNSQTSAPTFYGYNSMSPQSSPTSDPMYYQSQYAIQNNKFCSQVNPLYIGNTDTEIVAAITAKYIMIASKTGITYFGVRDQTQWETALTNNPPFVGFAYTNRLGSSWCNYNNSNTWHWSMATMNTGRLNMSLQPETTSYTMSRVSLAQGTDRFIPCAISAMHVPNYFNSSSSSSSYGLNLNWSAAALGNNTNMGQATSLQFGASYGNAQSYGAGFEPLFPIYSNHAGPNTNNILEFNENSFLDTPLQDVATGAYYPSATPIVFKAHATNSYCGSGTAPGILKGMNGPKARLESTIVTETEYTYNGDTYIPVWTGADINQAYSDLFFIKKA